MSSRAERVSAATLGMTLRYSRWRLRAVRNTRHRLHLLLPRPQLIERVAVVQATVLHHVTDRVRIANVVERVRIEHDEIGELPCLDRSEIAPEPDGFGAEDRRAAERVVVRHAAALYHPQLPVVAKSLELSMAADADA